jgi:serine/threonine-protein kinase HipA
MELDVWLCGHLVGHVIERNGKFRVEYNEETVDRFGPEIPVLSCSLPTPGPSRPDRSRAFLEGLLPEGAALEAMAARVRGVQLTPAGAPRDASDSVLLLGEYGRECAGAVAMAPTDSGWSPGRGRYDRVDDARLEQLIAGLPSAPLGTDPEQGRRMSLAGAQPKLVLARFDDDWYEPADGAASTHILKPTRSWPFAADNEAAVMWLASTLGLSSSDSWVEQIGPDRVYVAKRYDRNVTGSMEVSRSHQEDFCQALGVRPVDKYGLGRPSARIARVLRTWSSDLEADLSELFRQLTFRAIVGDEDSHGKNGSVMLNDGRVRLAPLYDSLCTMAYGELHGNMGTGIGQQVSLFKVDLQALIEEGQALGLPNGVARSIVDDLAERIRDALDGLRTLELAEEVAVSLVTIAGERVNRLLGGKPMGSAPDRTALDAPSGGRTTRAHRSAPG